MPVFETRDVPSPVREVMLCLAAAGFAFAVWWLSGWLFEVTTQYVCLLLPADPVEAADGIVYERRAIMGWVREHGARSPATGGDVKRAPTGGPHGAAKGAKKKRRRRRAGLR
mmetsp:Transcript_27743/g.111114  ORF Transcript_27743/g.111114 Transcript_27743/m.111114 type:complete len:112 (-) Transcript_27743:399-734(-)